MQLVENARQTHEVFEDHLRKAKQGEIEADLEQNYSEDVKIFTRWGVFQGHAGARELAQRLEEELPNAQFIYDVELVDGEMAYLEWSGVGDDSMVTDGADSFLIRDGKIVAQTIHYTVEHKS